MATDSPEVLERIKAGMDLVPGIAKSMRRTMGPYADVDELTSYGHEALVNAARSYQDDKGVPFRNWAAFKIRGHLMEAMRQRGPLPKRVYRRLRALQAADRVYEMLAEEDGSTSPPTQEIADEKLTNTLATAAAALALGFLHMKSADAMIHPVETEDDSPEELTAEKEMLQVIRDAIDERPEAERTLLVRHYFEDVTLEDAGKDLGLSKSWASRLHARALEGVAKSLKKRGTTSL